MRVNSKLTTRTWIAAILAVFSLSACGNAESNNGNFKIADYSNNQPKYMVYVSDGGRRSIMSSLSF